MPEPINAPIIPNSNARSLLPKGPWFARCFVVILAAMAISSVSVLRAIMSPRWWLPWRLCVGRCGAKPAMRRPSEAISPTSLSTAPRREAWLCSRAIMPSMAFNAMRTNKEIGNTHQTWWLLCFWLLYMDGFAEFDSFESLSVALLTVFNCVSSVAMT